MREIESTYPFLFESFIIPLVALAELVTFGYGTLWLVSFIGAFIGFCLYKAFLNQWNRALVFLSVFVIFIFTLAPFKTTDTIEAYKENIIDLDKQNKSYEDWRIQNPSKTYFDLKKTEQGANFLESLEFSKDFVIKQRYEIAINIAHQFLFHLFWIITFILCFPKVREVFSKVSNKVEEHNRVKKQKTEAEESEIRLQKRLKAREERAEDQRLKDNESKKLDIELEREKARQSEAEASVKLKKLDVERPEKEEKLSSILDKIDDL